MVKISFLIRVNEPGRKEGRGVILYGKVTLIWTTLSTGTHAHTHAHTHFPNMNTLDLIQRVKYEMLLS